MLMLYVLLVVNKIVRAQTIKLKNGNFIKLVWSIVCVIKQSLSSCYFYNLLVLVSLAIISLAY